jgi:hypothetical protein
MITSRVKHLLTITQLQRNHRYAGDQLAATLTNVDAYVARYRASPPPDPQAPSESVGKVDEALCRLGDLQLCAARLEELHAGLGVVRQIRAGAEDIPASIKRQLVEQVEVVVQNKSEFGLSTEVPAILLFFNDAVALCLPLPQSERHRFQLLEWYKLNSLQVTDTQPKTQAPTLRLSSRVSSASPQLPPGWVEVTKSGGKS